MSVQNVVLGQLIRRRGYGYELADRLRVWADALDLSEAAIYSALRGLEEKGLIVETDHEAPRRTSRQASLRVVFEATPEGRAHFERWMATAPRKMPLREELHMQMMVAEDKDIPAILEGLTKMEQDCRARLARVIGASFASSDAPHARISSFGAPLVQDALIGHLQTTLEWAQRSRTALLRRMGAGATGVPGRHRP